MEARVADRDSIHEPAGQTGAQSGSQERRAWFCLAVALPLLAVAYGERTIALAAWLAPVFLLRFVRKKGAVSGLSIAYVVLMAASAFQLRGMVPIPGAGYYVFIAGWAVCLVAPYALDRLLSRRIGGWKGLLVFPCAWVVVEYLVSLGPYGSWGSAAYSQFGELPLVQIVSVTGLWGLTFLLGWFATTVNLVWEQGLSSGVSRRSAVVYAGALVAVLLLGGARLALFPASSKTVRIASISKRSASVQAAPLEWGHMIQGRATAAELADISAENQAVNNDLLARSEAEMESGAQIVFWAESNGSVLKQDEAALIARGAELAARHHAYLGMALGTWYPGQRLPWENKLVLIQPDGAIAWQYVKARPVPGGDAAISLTADGKLQGLDTPYGRLSSAICFDADFPQLLRQAGRMRADILLDPSNDWPAIDPWHTQMASFRAVEEGFNMVRQTSQGLSAAYDYEGRCLARMDQYTSRDFAMVSEVPTRGARTIYSRLGDWVVWLCAAGLLLFVAIPLVNRAQVRIGRNERNGFNSR